MRPALIIATMAAWLFGSAAIVFEINILHIGW
jgi:hypothetical protein